MVVLIIHGGAGAMSRQSSTPEQQACFRLALASALQLASTYSIIFIVLSSFKQGHDVLHAGGEAMDAVVAAVASMEGVRCPLDTIHLQFRLNLARQSFVQCRKGCCFQC